MKKLVLLLFISSITFSQTNTEIHVFDIKKIEKGYNLINGKNISNNKGYDSQPHFYTLDNLLYASNRNGNTEVVLVNLNSKSDIVNIRSNTPKGGEYSPQRIIGTNDFSAVRLDNNGLQRFYKYNIESKKSTLLIKDLKVAYPAWYNKKLLVSATIINDSLELFISNLKKQTNISVAKMVGRSIHKIPNTNLMSFISKENKDYWLLKSLNPITKEIKTITSVGKSEDVTWLPNGTLLIAKGNSIYKFHPKKDKYPNLFFNFSDENINNISRITVNSNGSKIAIVAEVSPRYLAKEQLTAYNNKDIDAFLKPFSKNVKVYNFPNKLSYEGIEKMRENYSSFFKNTTDLHCKILKRIVFKDKVIDHELITANGKTFKAVAIYKMKNGKIVSVTFM